MKRLKENLKKVIFWETVRRLESSNSLLWHVKPLVISPLSPADHLLEHCTLESVDIFEFSQSLMPPCLVFDVDSPDSNVHTLYPKNVYLFVKT